MTIEIEVLLQEAKTASHAEKRQESIRLRISEVAQDYAERLEERAHFRELANKAHEAADVIRFRWWFKHFQGKDLEWWRAEIDSRMKKCGD